MSEQDTDREAIIALIHRNRIAVWTQDYDAYAACFVHAPYTTRWNASYINGIFITAGWDAISARVHSMFGSMPSLNVPENGYNTTVENLFLKIEGDTAWAVFQQRYPGTGLSPNIHNRGLTNEMRVFERHDGAWRIAFMCFLDTDASRAGGLMLELDREAKVLWHTPAAMPALEADDDLVIRTGKLRARDRATNERLQAAIQWAAGRDRGYLLGRGALPVVSAAGEGVPAKVWWVIADGGKIWFSFGDTGLTEARLSAAGAVFGLSPAQLQVAGHIAEGLSLPDIAGRMGITQNTARTHLDRIYDKTGVRTQPALVRVLLTAIAPL